MYSKNGTMQWKRNFVRTMNLLDFKFLHNHRKLQSRLIKIWSIYLLILEIFHSMSYVLSYYVENLSTNTVGRVLGVWGWGKSEYINFKFVCDCCKSC